MNTPRDDEKTLFEAARLLVHKDQRQAFLDVVCVGKPELRQRLDGLLAAQADADRFGDTEREAMISTGAPTLADSTVREATPAMAAGAVPVELTVSEKPGDRIGRYKLLQKIGEGGCGVVYMAEQEEPVRRRVALKVIKLGMDTKSVIARFEAERQALALMDHPNIAKVLDAGATEIGRPYFVMELVRGVKITEYCDRNNLFTRERLNLFVHICHAIQHAHQKGIIHRDIKPSNILVTLHDGMAVPKVIDFGIAKATQQRLTDKTLFTAYEQVIGTPAYMSPEQAEMSGLDIDTRSDIYSLGVLLYELLTGQTPFNAQQLLKAGLDEMRRTIREQEPARPSTRLSTMIEADLATVARHHQSDPPKLIHLLRGDLDWIVLKALEKDRTRRYETANDLAQDIVRHLEGEPVEARPPNTAYRIQKFVHRNKVMVAATALIAMALVLGVLASTWQAIRATRAEHAQIRLREDTEKARANEASQRQRADEAKQQAQAAYGQIAETLIRMEIQKAEELFTAGDSSAASDYLARVLRKKPEHRVAAERLLSALTHRSIVLPVTEPIRHKEAVWAASFSPDGQRIMTVSWDKTARIWDAATGQPLIAPLKHEGVVRSGQFSPDGLRVVTASEDKTARIWDAITGQPITPPLYHQDRVWSAQFSPDGTRVVTASWDKTACVWDARTGQLLTQPFKHKDSVLSAQFSPDGQWVVTASRDKTAGIWDAKTGQPLIQLLNFESGVRSAVFSPDGQRVVTASADKTARVWDAKTGRPVTEPLKHEAAVLSAQFSPDGQRVVTASVDKTARVWDAKTGQPVTEPLKHEAAVWSAQFSPDGGQIVTASFDKTARIWDARTGRLLAEPLRHELEVMFAGFSLDGRRLVTASSDGTARVWDAKMSTSLTEPLQHETGVNSAQFSADGRRVATASDGNMARVWDAKTGQLITPPLYHQDEVWSAQFSPDGRRVVTASRDKTARIWDAQTGQPLTEPLKHEGEVYSAQFSPEGQRVVTASRDMTARIWDAQTGQPLIQPLNHADEVLSAQFSPDGQRVVTASGDKTARIWDAQTGQPLIQPLHHEAWVLSAGFSPDGRRIITTSDDKTARIWDAKTGQLVTESLMHESTVSSAQFSPDGRRVVTASRDKTARIWDAQTGQPLTEPLRHEEGIVSAQFSPDGQRVVTASQDKTARIWDAQTGQPLTEPLKHGGGVRSAQFDPDGQRVVTASADKTARIWEVPKMPLPVPHWVPQLAEAVVHRRLNDHGLFEPVPLTELVRLRQELSISSLKDLWARWGRWYFEDPSSRAISPFSDLTIPDYVRHRLAEDTKESLEQALLVAPNQGLVLAHLARQELHEDSKFLAEAEWRSRRAVAFSPEEPEVWWVRAEVLGQEGKLSEALAAIERATQKQPNRSIFWNLHGMLLMRVNRFEEAYGALTKAIDLMATNRVDSTGARVAKPTANPAARKEALLARSSVLRLLGRENEARTDVTQALDLLPRDPAADDRLIDLTMYYNTKLSDNSITGATGNNLAEFPAGLVRLAGNRFDARGMVQLTCTNSYAAQAGMPGSVEGIRVGRKCRQLHCLHGTGFMEADDTEIARLVIHYAGGGSHAFSIRYGVHVRDWWHGEPADASTNVPQSVVAWTGMNKATEDSSKVGKRVQLRLFQTTFDIPSPDKAIATIDYSSAMKNCCPFLIAITVEP